MKQKTPLPIDPYLQEIEHLWRSHSTIIVKATPGSGKTTRLPWAIARNSSQKVVVLEPRRLPAKLAAQRIAFEEDLQIGDEVGYHFRFEKNHTNHSKLIFYTEGTFLRLLLSQQDKLEVGTVILDEFHERHLETDLALAALRSLQKKHPQLKLILMSATLESSMLEHFPGAKLIEISAKQFNVSLHYLPNQPSVLAQALETKIRRTIQDLPIDSGDILVFVPGMREMLRVKDHLREEFGKVFLLHADLTKEEQEEALGTSLKRKIILATNIAESSVTIPGIKVVIDSGIQRESRYSPWTGLKTLEDRPITQSSAIQRAGRAGRTSDGICFRLYSEQDFNSREPFTVPEVLRADLTDIYLLSKELKGEPEWYTPPPPERWEKARELLFKLGALTDNSELTSVGQQLLDFPLGVRLARTLIAARGYSYEEKKKLLNFISETIEKDPSKSLTRKLHHYLKENGKVHGQFERALLAGFIDQVARYRRKQNDFIHYSGKTLKAHASQRDLHHDFYLVLDITPRMEAFVLVPIEEDWLYEIEPFPFTEETVLSVADKFNLKRETRIGSIPLDETALELDWRGLSQDMKEKVLIIGEAPFRKRWKEFQETETFLRLHYLMRFRQLSVEEVEKEISLKNYLAEFQELSWENIGHYFEIILERTLNITSNTDELPLSVRLAGKRELKVHYPYGLDPFVEAPIQDFYGVTETPTIMNGKVSLALKLLGPHKRPIQVTRDLKGFWKKTYQEMKKEWQREYPRHHWPDTPETAKPVLLKRMLGD